MSSSGTGSSTGKGAGAQARSSIKETFTSIIIAFALAFLFRGFVVEAFQIPTGSMAPTLMGAHLRFQDPNTGYDWPMNYPYAGGSTPARPLPSPLTPDAPLTRKPISASGTPVDWGDRIFVMKYLGKIYSPSRWDAVVFKNPTEPGVNFIKRLLGLAGEQIALVDGDVFTRTARADDPQDANAWSLPGWKVSRKPEMAQRAMWQLVFDSQYTPLDIRKTGTTWQPPWHPMENSPERSQWKLANGVYSFSGSEPGALAWNESMMGIDDYYAYNAPLQSGMASRLRQFPVSDVRVCAGLRPQSDGLTARVVLEARGQRFQAELASGKVAITMQPLGSAANASAAGANGGDKKVLAEAPLPAGSMRAGHVTNVEFWHVDQRVQVWIDGELAAQGDYDWTPEERVRNVLGVDMAALSKNEGVLTDPSRYGSAQVRWEFAGGAVTMYRVALWRDIFYRPDVYDAASNTEAHPKMGQPALATAPSSTLTLKEGQYFACGDNSPASHDGRKWGYPHPWVAEIDPTMGIVHEDLMIGKAFFVYFPAPKKSRSVPVPDVGRMRWIW